MWKTEFLDGKVMRDGFADQWEVLKSGFKADGSRYKKVEALQLESGAEIYKKQYINVTEHHTSVTCDGNYGGTYVRKTSAPRLQKFILIEY